MVLALIFGAVIYKVISNIFDKILCYKYGMTTLSTFDEFFLTDDTKCNLCSCLRFESFDFDKMS
jgi:hypothetical protein